jgi:hypothetical protein
MIQDRKTGEWFDPEVKFRELLEQDWFRDRLDSIRMKDHGYKDVTLEEPPEFEQVLVTDGTEFRVLHREEGVWAFEVAPCDRTAMKFWKKLTA